MTNSVARLILKQLEQTGISENNLTMEQVYAIRRAQGALDDITEFIRLLEKAIYDINFYVDCFESRCDDCCCSQDSHCHWKNEVEAMKLIKEWKND